MDRFRLPILALLIVLEPVVRTVLATLALFGILITLFFTFYGVPNFPTWAMLSISLGFALALMLYETLIRLLSS